jgi:hypothetical protein
MLSRFHSELLALTEAHPNKRFAAEGIRRVKPGYQITLWATYSSQSVDSDWNLELNDPDVFVARFSEPGRDTIHKVEWQYFKGITIEIFHKKIRNENGA